MITFVHWFFGTGEFMSHGYCYLWNQALLRLHVISDLCIGIAYIAISSTLWNFVRKTKKDVPFDWLFVAFGIFIIACGATHLMEVLTVWTPVYWVSGTVKAITAAASVITAIALPPVVPKCLTLLSDARKSDERRRDLQEANVALRTEIAERKRAEDEIGLLNRELEILIRERTSALAQADSTLNATIAELERTEQRFEQMGEDSFRLIANSIPQLAWIADKDGWIYWYNQRWYDYTGTTLKEMEGWGWESVHDPQHLTAVKVGWTRALQAKEPFDMEFPLRAADGAFRRFITRVQPVKGRDGTVARWVGTNTDIEDHRRTEERLRLLYDSGMMGVFSWSPDGVITDANDTFLQIVGYDRHDLSAGELNWTSMTPLEWAAQDRKTLQQLRERGVVKPVEKEYIRRDGSRVPIEIGVAIYEMRQREGVAFILDITQRKHAEAKLAELNQNLEQRVLDRTAELAEANAGLALANHKLAESRANLEAVLDSATAVAIFATDPQGFITVFNRGAERMLQYSAEEVAGVHTPALFHGESSRQAGSDGSAYPICVDRIEQEWCYVRKDSTTLEVRLSTTPVRDENRNITGFVSTASDITAQKALERELRDRNLLLEKGVEERTDKLRGALLEKTVLLKEVHHRVKNNLAVVAGLLAMQADAIGDEVAARSLLESQRRVQSMALIHEHLYGTENLSRVRFDEYAGKLADELCEAFASPPHIHLSIQAEPIELSIDKAIPCGLILNELISNAFKYAFPGGREGQIDVRFARPGCDFLYLAVKDDGIGFPENFDWETSESLGLKIIQILVKQLAGRLDVTKDKGLEFALTFPAEQLRHSTGREGQ